MDKINICLNYYGQPRDTEITKNTFNTFINTSNNINYHIVYTTWKDENIDAFQQLFPNSYINLVDKPDMQNYDNLINNYRIDDSNNWRKSMEHYIIGMYIKKMSYTTINDFEEKNNINFDFIVSLRTDTYLDNHLCNFYDIIGRNLDNVVYVANNPTFAVHNQPALPDVMFISNKNTSKKILEQLDVLDKCAVNNTNFFHPESSFYNAITFLKINIYKLSLSAFPQYPIPRWP